MKLVYNYTITRLSYFPMFCFLFTTGIIIGGVAGLTLGYLDRVGIGWLGGGFIGFLTGIGSGIVGLIYTLIFNTLAPVIGGIPVRLENLSEQERPTYSNLSR